MSIICGEPCCVWGGWGWVSRCWSPVGHERYISSPDLPLTKQHSLYKLFSSYKSTHNNPTRTVINSSSPLLLLSSFVFSFSFSFSTSMTPPSVSFFFFFLFCASSLYLAFFFFQKFRERAGGGGEGERGLGFLFFLHFPPPKRKGRRESN